jgi:hypothetical protein
MVFGCSLQMDWKYVESACFCMKVNTCASLCISPKAQVEFLGEI